MVAISKVVNFRTRLSLSEILSDLIRRKLVRYPWFCSARSRSFTCFKMADVYYAYWSKFPSQSEAPIRFLFRDQVCFSTSLLNLMYLSIFVRVATYSNKVFFLCWVDYALEGSTFSLSKCDFSRMFHTERSWHTYRLTVVIVFWSAGFALWCKRIFFDLFWSVKLFYYGWIRVPIFSKVPSGSE